MHRFNYTGRIRIKQKHVRLTLYECGDTFMFDAGLQLDQYDLPPEAKVFVEVQRQTSLMRFDFGAVSRIQPPSERLLTEFGTPDGVVFRVKVVSSTDKKAIILAEADRIHPRNPDEDEQKRISLLPVKPDPDLDEEISRIDFSGDPILLINSKRFPNWREVALHPVFISLTYPFAMREILMRILRIEKRTDIDGSDWCSLWLRFTTSLPGISSIPNNDDESNIEDWINQAVASFCRINRISQRFENFWMGGDKE